MRGSPGPKSLSPPLLISLAQKEEEREEKRTSIAAFRLADLLGPRLLGLTRPLLPLVLLVHLSSVVFPVLQRPPVDDAVDDAERERRVADDLRGRGKGASILRLSEERLVR